MTQTNVMLELEATQEYTGQAKHACNLALQWESYLKTGMNDQNETLADIISGKVFPFTYSGAAAVSNFGRDPSWTGHALSAVNAYAFGKFAWTPTQTAASVTRMWTEATFGLSADRKVLDTVQDIQMRSWVAYENYTSPLGIGFVCAGNHYDMDMPHRESTTNANRTHIGYERGIRWGSLYNGTVARAFESIDSCPEQLLLFFHNVPYTHRLVTKGNCSVLQYIYASHKAGAMAAVSFANDWAVLQSLVNSTFLYENIDQHLKMGAHDAGVFSQYMISFFTNITGIPPNNQQC